LTIFLCTLLYLSLSITYSSSLKKPYPSLNCQRKPL
jgi:hypothetical protein